MDSNHYESESDTMTAKEEEGYLKVDTGVFTSQCAPSQSCYTECSSAQVQHSPSSPHASEDDDSGSGGGGGG